MNYPKREKVVEVSLTSGTYSVFPRRLGVTTNDAMSIVNGAMKGAELPMIPVHKLADRDSELTYVNAFQIQTATENVVDVPERITSLYTKPEDETPEDEEIRLGTINNYFSLR
nr:hypothetical protein [Enterococcus phage Sw5]